MNAEQAKLEIADLTKAIEHHRFAYYVLDRTDITDAEFDKLFLRLQELEAKFPELKSESSPTTKVGAPPSTEFNEVRHRIPLLSLANAMNEEELDKWGEGLVRALVDLDAYQTNGQDEDDLQYVCELKIDGLSVALTYENGILIKGATRGNGDVGEDVTLNLKTIKAIPQKLTPLYDGSLPELLEVRGEVYLPVSIFSALNKSLLESGEAIFANPRNAASGALRQKDPRKTKERNLSFWAYFAYVTDKKVLEPTSHFETLQLLQSLGFPVEPGYKRVKGIDAVKQYCRSWAEKRHSLDYQTDGVVLKLDDRRLWRALGATSHSPRWAVAFKYPPEEAETELEEIRFEVGRTGAVTPVAFLKPVHLAGTTVKRASLHNADQIARLDVRLGDTVVVRKAGEIIPELVMVKLDKRPKGSEPFVYPLNCPDCGTELERGDEVVYRCPNAYGCPSQAKRRLAHFVSRDAMDIEGAGEVLVEQLVDSKLVKDAADLYGLSMEGLANLERMGKKSAQNLVLGIEKSKTRPLANLIFALGIRHVGLTSAELLAQAFGSMERIANASIEELTQTDGIGPTIAEAVFSFFRSHQSRDLISRLESAGVNTKQQESETGMGQAIPQIFAGKTFVITGTLEGMERERAEQAVKRRGGKCTSSVSKRTDYLICGASPGSKLSKAQELGITIVNEEEFLKLLGS